MPVRDPLLPARQLWVVWVALLGCQFVYAAVAAQAVAKQTQSDLEPFRSLVTTLSLAAVVAGASAVILWRTQIMRALETGRLDLRTRAGWQKFFTLCLVCWALAEFIGVCGLILALTTRALSLMVPFSVSGIILLLLFAPRLPTAQTPGACPE